MNGGRDGHGEEGNLRAVFEQYGHITHIVKVPGQAHALIAYDDVSMAMTAKGKQAICIQSFAFFLARMCTHKRVYSISTVAALHELACASLIDNGRVLYMEYIRPEHLEAETLGQPEDVPGLHLGLNFISAGEEDELMAFVARQPWHELRRRRVQHYGYRFDYSTNAFDPNPEHATPLPAVFANLAERAHTLGMCRALPVIMATLRTTLQ